MIRLFPQVAHDGPVTTVTRSPFFSDLVLTVGGYLLAVWRETELTQPLIGQIEFTKPHIGQTELTQPVIGHLSLRNLSLVRLSSHNLS